MMLTFVMLILIGYLIGSIPSSYLSMRFFTGKDIRTMGTGNATVTAVLMHGGKRPALVAFVAEITKGAICILIAYLMVGELWASFVIIVAAVVGCSFSLWLRGRPGNDHRRVRPGFDKCFGGAHHGSLVYCASGSHQTARAEQSALPFVCPCGIVAVVQFLGICPGRMLARDAFLHKRVESR
jgi:hypothetical protein